MILSFLDRERTVAKPGFNRWMVPPAALCMHLCIGQAYAFSVFNLPMTKLIGITQSAPGDWKLTELGWIFSIAMFFLGTSAAVFGRWATVMPDKLAETLGLKERLRSVPIVGPDAASQIGFVVAQREPATAMIAALLSELSAVSRSLGPD